MRRPPIPSAVARQLRQEAGFGCCKCGLPIYDYHHIVPYHADDPYPPDEMMILCPNHHRAAGTAITLDEQWRLKAAPYNIGAGLVEGLLVTRQPYAAVAFGGVLIVGEDARLSIDGETVLGIGLDRPGRTLALSARLYDRSDELLAVIERNEWVSGDPLPWDIESGYQHLRIRQRERSVALDIDARTEPVRVRAKLWRSGAAFFLGDHGIRFGEGQRAGGIANLGLVGMSIELDSASGVATANPDPRIGQARLVARADPGEQLVEAIQAWRQLTQRGRNDLCWCGSGVKFKKCHGR